MNQEVAGMQGGSSGTVSEISMQGTADFSPTNDVGLATSQAQPLQPLKVTPPSSPQNSSVLPKLPLKGFDSTNRNIQSLRLDQSASRQTTSSYTSTASHTLYSPLSSHPTSPSRRSNTSQASVKLFHSPRVRQVPATSTPSPLSSPRNAHFPGNEPSSPTSSRTVVAEPIAIPEEDDTTDSNPPSSLQVGKLREPARPLTASGRSRGSTTSGPLPQHRILRTATSIPELKTRGASRKPPSTTYKPDRGGFNPESSHSPLPRDKSGFNESVRNSFRSGFTIGSASYLDASGTERSSLISKSDTASEFAFNFSPPPVPESSRVVSTLLSVEDAIGMYERGFYDDPPEIPEAPQESSATGEPSTAIEPKEQSDFKDEGYDSQATLARSPSTQESTTTSTSNFERTGSLEKYEGDRLESQVSRALSLPKTHHTRSSTQIITGRASATPSGMSDLSPPARRDRYGFKCGSQNVTEVKYDVWNFHYIDYLARRKKKWLGLMKQLEIPSENPVVFPPASDQVKRFVRKGIPPEWRGAAWFYYAGGPEKLAANPDLYSDLISQIEDGKLSDLDREHIERDLHRTFPDNIRFKPEEAPSKGDSDKESMDRPDSTAFENETSIVKALRRVLQAFAIHNPNIGYCQSLNFLAGLLLLFLNEDEEKSFVLLNVITTEYLPGTHGKILEANVDIGVLMGCIKESLPLVWAKIDDTTDTGTSHIATTANRLPTVSLATTSWFMSLFVSSLPIETVLRVWDCLFYEGSKILFRVALAIFKIAEDNIRAVGDSMEIFQLVQNLPRQLINPNHMMEVCFKKRNNFGYVTQETIDARRAERRRLNATDILNMTGSQPLIERKPSALRRAASKSRFKRSFSRKRPLTPNPTS